MILAGWPLPKGVSVCRDCKTAVHDGDLCIECWRDRRELAIARDREWWSA